MGKRCVFGGRVIRCVLRSTGLGRICTDKKIYNFYRLDTREPVTEKPYETLCVICCHMFNLKIVKSSMEDCYFSKVPGWVLLQVTIFHGCFSPFLNCANGICNTQHASNTGKDSETDPKETIVTKSFKNGKILISNNKI